MGLREHFEGALPSTGKGERAGFRDARSAALHGVTSEASGVSRWRAAPVEREPPLFAGGSGLPSHAVAPIKRVLLLIGQDRERGVANADLMLDRHGFLAASM